MFEFDFDALVNREGTNAMKIDALEDYFGDKDVLPLWVADMDFESPKEVQEALLKMAEHGVFGYSMVKESFYESILNWVSKRHDWQIEREWVSYIPGIVRGISFAIDCFMTAGDKVVIQPPVYPPFRNVPTAYKYPILENPLILKAGKFEMDLDGFEKLVDQSCRVLILCNPHNPGGRIWTKKELEAIADICYESGILVISDEIHSDLALNGNKHIPFATVSKKAAQNSITFMAPSKTFNIAGIVSSFCVIPNEILRDKFFNYLSLRDLDQPHMFVAPATEAAYNYGEKWLTAVTGYIAENAKFVADYCEKNIPSIKVDIPDASFLLWLDCRELELSQEDLVDLFVKEAKLGLNNGVSFGKEGEGFMRMNIGTSRSVLEKALGNLKKAVDAKQ